MWKYVTRRIRDSVERTCNVLESRRTWTCGGAEKNTGPPANAADDQQAGGDGRPPPSQHHHFGCRGGAVWPPPVASQALAPIHRSRYDRRGGGSGDDFRRHHQRCHSHQHGVLGALTWSGAIVAGWYTSQLFGMRRRRRQQLLYAESHRQRLRNIGCGSMNGGLNDATTATNSVAAAGPSCPFAAAIFGQWAHSAPPQPEETEPQAAKKSRRTVRDDEWLQRVLQAANLRPEKRCDGAMDDAAVLEERVWRVQAELVGFGATVDLTERDEVDCSQVPSASLTPIATLGEASERLLQSTVQASPLEPPTKLQQADTTTSTAAAPPPTFSGAVQDLLKVIGDIEFQLGVQHMQDERFAVAVTHFKLGTGHHHAGATFNLGLCYELGLGVERSASKALECFVLAADQGHPKALYNVGVYHGQGRGGLAKNRRAAREFFAAAARAGQEDAVRALGGKVRVERSRVIEDDSSVSNWKTPVGEYVPQSNIFRAVAVA